VRFLHGRQTALFIDTRHGWSLDISENTAICKCGIYIGGKHLRAWVNDMMEMTKGKNWEIHKLQSSKYTIIYLVNTLASICAICKEHLKQCNCTFFITAAQSCFRRFVLALVVSTSFRTNLGSSAKLFRTSPRSSSYLIIIT
jgi:hypothetical protein